MDPFGLVAFALGAAVGGIIGNRADDTFCRVMNMVIERLRRGGRPVNHDLQRAVRKAYLQATLAVCEAMLKELGAAPSWWRRDPRVRLRPSDEIRWLDKVRGAILEELRRLPRAEYEAPSSEADKQIEILLQPKGTTGEKRKNELSMMLKKNLVEELSKHGEPPARFTEMVQQGWKDVAPDGKTAHLDWFDLLCAFFVHELKTNEKVRTIFEGQLLAQLTVESAPLTLEQFEKLSEVMGKRLEQLDAHLAQLRAEQAEGLAAVQERLDEMLPLLALLPDIAAQQQVLTALLQEALREMRRRPDEVLRWLRQRFSAEHLVVALQQRTQAFIHRLCQKPFVPRQAAWQQLSEFVMQEQGGVAVLHAPAGYGKTTFLANWVNALQREGGIAVAYHFFSKDPDLGGYATKPMNAFAHLLGQIAAMTQTDGVPIAFSDNPDERRAQLERAMAELKLAEGERLVVVLDGLDDAEEAFYPPVQKPLPNGVFVVVSGRWDGAGDPPDYLVNWLEMADRTVQLDAMDEDEIAEWLKRLGDGELQAFADDRAFVRQLRETTDGLPLFLTFLLDDLRQAAKQGKDVRQSLAQTPKGFSKYVAEQLKQLAPLVKREQAVRTLFAVLSVAKGALRESELKAITDLSAWDLEGLPHQATRWWHIGEQDGERAYGFTHTLLATEFAKALGKEAEAAEQKLLAWCADWRTHNSAYALRHYAEHLREAKRWDELFALARDRAFHQAQAQAFPAEPDLPLRTVRAALLSAAERDDAAAMAEFLITHARRLLEIRQENPLEALRKGHLQRAWELADLFEIERCVLWHLLLAWELKDAGRLQEAGETLRRLMEKQLPRFSGWHGQYASYLLSHIPDVSEEAFDFLQERLLGDADAGALCEELSRRRHFSAALKTARRIEKVEQRAEALVGIAKAQAEAGERERARETFSAALETALGIEWAWERAEALCAIAKAQAEAGEFGAALETALGIEWAWERAEALCAIAKAQAEAGEFSAALETAQGIKDAWRRAEALVGIAKAQAEAGERERAKETFSAALETAQGIEDAWRRAMALVGIAKAQAEAGEFGAAFETAQGIEDAWRRAMALVGIAKAQAEAGERERAKETFSAALETAQGIEDAWRRAEALVGIAKAQAEAGERERARETFSAALETAQGIEDAWRRAMALVGIAKAQAEAGERERAKETFSAAFETAQGIEDAWRRAEALVGIAKAQAEAGEFSAALETAQGIEDAWRRAEALVGIAKAQAEAGEFGAALETAQGIKDAWRRAMALVGIAKAQAEAGEFGAALETAQGIEGAWERAEALGAIAKAQAEAGEFGAALETALGIEWAWRRAEALGAIAKAQAEAGERERARETFSTALETAQGIEAAWWRAEALCAIAKAQAEAGEFSAALETAQGIKDAWRRAEALVGIAKAQAEAGERERAKETFSAALETAQGIEDAWRRAMALVGIAKAQAEAGERERAKETFSAAFETAQGIEDAWRRAEALVGIAKAQAEAGEFSAALETAQGIKDAWRRAEALGAIAKAQAEAGERERARETFSAALETAQGIEDAWRRAMALVAIAKAQAEAGERERARETFSAASETVRGIKGAWERAKALGVIAEAQAEAGEFGAALETARGIEEAWRRAEALGAIAKAQAEAGEFSAALETAQGIEAAWWRAEALCAIAKAQAEAGEFSAALETALGIEWEWERAEALGAIAKAQAEAGERERARETFSAALETAQGIKDAWRRAMALVAIAKAQAEAGLGEGAVRTAEMILTDRNERLPKIAEALVIAGDKEHFKQLLLPCAYYLDAAYKMCGLLARLYPKQVLAVAEVVRGEVKSESGEQL